MAEPSPDLQALLAHPPAGVDVDALADRARIRLVHVGRAPAMAARPFRPTLRGVSALVRAFLTARFPRRRWVEIEVLDDALRIQRWHCSFRDVRAIRRVYDLPGPRKMAERPPNHRVELQVGEEWWGLVPTGGASVTSWLAQVFAAGRARAIEGGGRGL